MKASQVYSLVNEMASQSLGSKAVAVVDARSLVSLGDVVLSSSTDKEAFLNVLMDRVGRTIIAVRDYEPKTRRVMKRDFEWGAILQKISFTMGNAVENSGWDIPITSENKQANPFDVVPSTAVDQKLFKALATWEYDDVIPDYQMKVAFTNADAMAGFIAGIYTTISNAMAVALENTTDLAVCTAIANIAVEAQKSQGNTNCLRNLLNEYNTKVLGLTWDSSAPPAGWLYVAGCLTDKDFLKYVSKELAELVGHMKRMSKAFNVERHERFTPADKCVVEVLQHVASASKFFLEADTYHNTLVSLPAYEEVEFWQGSGVDFGFADCSKVSIKTGSSSSGTTTTLTGVIAFVHDDDGVASIMTNMRSHSIYNPKQEVTNIFRKADKGYAVDLSENGVVLYVADPS